MSRAPSSIAFVPLRIIVSFIIRLFIRKFPQDKLFLLRFKLNQSVHDEVVTALEFCKDKHLVGG